MWFFKCSPLIRFLAPAKPSARPTNHETQYGKNQQKEEKNSNKLTSYKRTGYWISNTLRSHTRSCNDSVFNYINFLDDVEKIIFLPKFFKYSDFEETCRYFLPLTKTWKWMSILWNIFKTNENLWFYIKHTCRDIYEQSKYSNQTSWTFFKGINHFGTFGEHQFMVVEHIWIS